MALRALLFSADSSATAVLCEILTDLHVEAEICAELLVAVERLTRESYDAILVDWDQESESVQLLKSAREKKSGQALKLALVRDDKGVGRALQQGANSVIKKPIDTHQAEETLSTARDLILSRRTEKENRVAAVAERAAAGGHVEDETSGEKTGFVQQTAPRSAFEVAAQAAEPESTGNDGSGWQAARGPAEVQADRESVQPTRPSEKKRWDEHKFAVKSDELKAEGEAEVAEPEAAGPEAEASSSPSRDATGVFSSLPEDADEEHEQQEQEEGSRRKPHSQLIGFALVACMLIAGVLYVWAPGDSFGDRLTSMWRALPFASGGKTTEARPPAKAPEKSAPEMQEAKSEEPAADTAPIPTTDVDPSKIQIIETKPIPKSGAQVPPSDTPPPGSDQAIAQAQRQNEPPAASVAVGSESTPLAAPLQGERSAEVRSPAVKPGVVPVAQQRPAAPMVVESQPASGEKGGVIIPDSLKNSPSQSASNSFRQTVVPEDISRNLVTYRVDPEYPVQAQEQRLEGSVVLQVWIGMDGSVQDLKLMKGYIVLGKSAVDAVRQWRFKPYGPNGKPIDYQTSVTVNFKLPG